MKTTSLFLAFLCITSIALAETVHLKDGREVSGKIITKDSKSVKINSDGVTMTYYADEVADVDGEPLGESPAAAPAAPAAALPVADVSSGSKRDLILKFIDVFGTRAAMTQNLQAMLKNLPADDPEAQKLKNTIKVDEIIERLIPVYDKQFTEDELKAYIAFYGSPEGRKLVEGIPVIMKESIGISTAYFQEKFPELKQGDK